MTVVLRVEEASAKYLTTSESSLTRGFELLATAQGGVSRLRELILLLAVQGKLFDVKSRRSDSLVELPPDWSWTTVGEVCSVVTDGEHSTPTRCDDASAVPLVTAKNVRDGAFDLRYTDFVPREVAARCWARCHPEKSDILMVSVGATLGRLAVLREAREMVLVRSVTLLRPRPEVISAEYLALDLRSPNTQAEIWRAVKQSAQPCLYLGKTSVLAIALPPLAEQHRIVARVEELMKLCDALEQNGRLADEQHARLTSTLFDALAASESAHALAENWQRVAEHFDLLLDRPEAIDALEQTILHLAVHGLLVPQIPGEGSGSDLLEHFAQASPAAAKRGQAAVAPLDEEDVPFALPGSWAWARFGDVADVSGGVTLGRKGALVNPLRLPYLRVANVQRGRLNLTREVKTVDIAASELPRFQLKAGDLLITEGGDWDKVGRTCIWNGEIATCLHQNHVFRARGRTAEWLPEWGQLYLNSADARAYFAASAKQTTNLASINMTQLRHCAFPLPPLPEQRRIVARVEELRRICVHLRERLTQARETQSRLANALVAEAA